MLAGKAIKAGTQWEGALGRAEPTKQNIHPPISGLWGRSNTKRGKGAA